MKQNKNDLKNAKLLAAIINNKPKQKLLSILEKRGKCTVTQLIKATGWEQSLVSQHLAGLRKWRMVDTRKVGKFVIYYPNREHAEIISKWAARASDFITTK